MAKTLLLLSAYTGYLLGPALAIHSRIYAGQFSNWMPFTGTSISLACSPK